MKHSAFSSIIDNLIYSPIYWCFCKEIRMKNVSFYLQQTILIVNYFKSNLDCPKKNYVIGETT